MCKKMIWVQEKPSARLRDIQAEKLGRYHPDRHDANSDTACM